MKQLNILVTGGAGFIGSHLVDKLLLAGHRVVALDNLCNGRPENISEAGKHPEFKFIKGDILDINTCDSVTRDIDVVYH